MSSETLTSPAGLTAEGSFETVTSLCNHKEYNRLSKLQKSILVYARKAMIAKEQRIDHNEIVFHVLMPEWLSGALVKAWRVSSEGANACYGKLATKRPTL